jgi:hypothetical protein
LLDVWLPRGAGGLRWRIGGRYRIEREGRFRLHPARLRPLDRECRQRAGAHPDRIQCRNARDHLSQWIAANPQDVLATNFGQPAEVFAKFPDRDAFIAGKDATG